MLLELILNQANKTNSVVHILTTGHSFKSERDFHLVHMRRAHSANYSGIKNSYEESSTGIDLYCEKERFGESWNEYVNTSD